MLDALTKRTHNTYIKKAALHGIQLPSLEQLMQEQSASDLELNQDEVAALERALNASL